MRTLLLVEDDLALQESISAALHRTGYRVLTASNGVQALQIVADTVPLDMVVLDIQLPPVDRLTVCRSVRSRRQVRLLMFDRDTGITVRASGSSSDRASATLSPSSLRRLLSCVEAVLTAPPDDRLPGDVPPGETKIQFAPLSRRDSRERPRGAGARRFPARSPFRSHRP
jgi:DNA-binding response OmpR family regulator